MLQDTIKLNKILDRIFLTVEFTKLFFDSMKLTMHKRDVYVK